MMISDRDAVANPVLVAVPDWGHSIRVQLGHFCQAPKFQNADMCYELETAWDLWHWDGDWKLAPSRVLIICYGPEFERDGDENLRIDFGLDEQFLPGAGGPEGMRMLRENIQSLLRLVHDLDGRLKVEHRQLWSESGENFADLLQSALRAG